ncbi:TRAP transporter large permease [Vibrio gazogenes]|uniref:TRAP transporter large permease protein n=1 Tax=Vibrio gazogenes DSM 21264 = NBRC 103151 TaxID=1123492 RepID=A0A1M5GYN4_VIBGA|nr:TRAP transporter large permease [Vibrio gazogenes]USP15779.1 TRAP transporter large permease [Vibrio gazogenes]SHG08821.1 TRAP transporter, DctM subunit [Vibrio gazogenes DSM 21264] [Vibrio gazogenes DSM 21264 = NBRC 103151]SJN52764.1 Sialic acid TRAP transporter permease protein SiaT [Vibrio gazogenes]
MEVIILFATFFILLFVGLPIAITLALASMSYLFLMDIPYTVIPQKMYAGMDSFVLLCVPGFILAGNLMNRGNITEQIINLSNAMVGHIRGGLGLANVAGSMLFGGVSGTAVADTASIGGVMIPGMSKAGYDTPFSAAVTAASSTIGPIIPPSVPMIIVGTLTGISVGQMFLAGAIPGLLLGFGMMITVYILAVKRHYPKEEKVTFKQLLIEMKRSSWAVSLTMLILVGIIGGFFTPTEASIVAAFYALIIGLYIYRGLKWRDVPSVLVATAVTSASLLILVGFANVFGWILTSERIPQMIASAILNLSENKFVVLLIINLLLLLVGSFMETIAALIILFPTLLGVATSVGVNPVHFGIIAVLNLMIGLSTPPVGVCLFVASSIGGISMEKVAKAIVPFLICNIIILLIVTYVPAVALWLPGMFYQ